jgi:hypothetical protein
MTHHPFHSGRYSGATVIPHLPARAVPAAALVVTHTRLVPLAPMFRQLDANPAERGIAGMRLAPITAYDFYAHDLPDLHALGSEEHAAGHPPRAAGDLRARTALAVPAAGRDVPAVHASVAGRDGGEAAVEGAC